MGCIKGERLIEKIRKKRLLLSHENALVNVRNTHAQAAKTHKLLLVIRVVFASSVSEFLDLR